MSSQKEQNFIANSTRRKILRKYRDPMIVHIVVYIMLLSISNCCATINIHLFIIIIYLLPGSPIRGVGNSLTHGYGESATPRLTDAGSLQKDK